MRNSFRIVLKKSVNIWYRQNFYKIKKIGNLFSIILSRVNIELIRIVIGIIKLIYYYF